MRSELHKKEAWLKMVLYGSYSFCFCLDAVECYSDDDALFYSGSEVTVHKAITFRMFKGL